jgi:hypothetical protein
MNGQRLTGLATPTADQDAATRGYVLSQVENAAAGIDSKPSVRLVSTSNITRAGLQTIDGIALLAGERILLVGQSAASENGVYVVAAGAWTRAVDADSASEITPGAFWFIEEGNTYGRSQWRCNNTGTITIGSTAITIVQFGAATMYTAGTGLQVNNSTEFAVKPVSSGGITVSASGVQVDTTIVARKYSTTIGDGTTTSIAVTHNLGTKDIQVSIRETTTDTSVWTEWVATNTNTVTLNFTNAPAASGLRVSVVG